MLELFWTRVMRRLVESGRGDIVPWKLRRAAHEMQHFHQGPFAFSRLAGNQHQITRINGAVNDPMERRSAQRAHDLRRNAQDRAHRHWPVRVDPFFNKGPIEIFCDVNKVMVLNSEIIQGADVDMIQLLRGNRFRFELFAHRHF